MSNTATLGTPGHAFSQAMMPSRFGGMLERIVLMPFVVIPDYVLDILFILFNMWWAAQFK